MTSTGWFARMSPPERRTFWSCFWGWALDAMDVQIYSLVIPTIIATWDLSTREAGEIATATLLSSALGGWIAGALADRIGRVRTLQLTILWFSIFTLVCSLAQTFEQLLVARTLMGLGFGGEWTAGAVLIGEVIRPEHRGRAVGTVQSGWAVGWALALTAQVVTFQLFEPEIAWRALFAVGVAPAALVLVLRRFVAEPPVFEETRRRVGARARLREIVSRPLLRITVLTSLLTTGAQGGYYAIATWLPTYLETERGLGSLGTSAYLAVVIAGSFAGYLTGAHLADRIGRRALFFVFAIGAAAIVVAYTSVELDDGSTWTLHAG
ncbi:MFS transporter [Sandaracinus amylolyticus]|uniref:Sialic acid transporter (Permease) NanT n=1 Tax=Sandaracinus amylolyticus TaxID=927083 RepID=A0A0F6SHG0_9BACT|nr:MFS transporter [Sandaracinus amylolyticus]AKF10379.1 Sialic acid transporter (permease) NanT [Sandaracinus amylolyticus]